MLNKTLRNPSFQWTKDKIEKVLDLWEGHTGKAICEELGCKEFQLMYIAKALREKGVELPKKRVTGVTQHLIDEVIAERKLIRR